MPAGPSRLVCCRLPCLEQGHGLEAEPSPLVRGAWMKMTGQRGGGEAKALPWLMAGEAGVGDLSEVRAGDVALA